LTIPLQLKAASIEKTILQSRAAIMKRLKGRSWTVREGIPDMRALPDDGPAEVSVWIFPTETGEDREGASSNWHSEVFATDWIVTIVCKDTGPDPAETSFGPVVKAASAVLEALTSHTKDVTLDGSVNWTNRLRARYGIATAGGDRHRTVASLSLRAHHPMFPNRRLPPGV